MLREGGGGGGTRRENHRHLSDNRKGALLHNWFSAHFISKPLSKIQKITKKGGSDAPCHGGRRWKSGGSDAAYPNIRFEDLTCESFHTLPVHVYFVFCCIQQKRCCTLSSDAQRLLQLFGHLPPVSCTGAAHSSCMRTSKNAIEPFLQQIQLALVKIFACTPWLFSERGVGHKVGCI
jgi:hypothetical protein